MEKSDKIKALLHDIYGESKGDTAYGKIFSLIEKHGKNKGEKEELFSEKDIVLITYGDSLTDAGKTPLKTLSEFTEKHLKNIISAIHILPFCPFSSDDGFSVMDFHAVNKDLGTWENIEEISQSVELMFDLVLNHISAQSGWFENYLNGQRGFENLAIEMNLTDDLSKVTRPRSLPLLTKFNKTNGDEVHLWTTFSSDQIDLNYKSIDLLEKMVNVLLGYVKNRASMIRLDAIAYLWKELGSKCIHLEKTHKIVKLFRGILDLTAPDTMIITETNVPHQENISYFGKGNDEAQMVYNFTLPPLLLHSFIESDTTKLSKWAKNLQIFSNKNTFFNFTASHDGIGVRPLEGVVSSKELDNIINTVKENGGDVSYKDNPDGSKSPYELNITYVDALLDKKNKETHVDRFIASQAVALSLPGMPAIYIHSLLGSRNWQEGVSETKRARTINRKKLVADEIEKELNDKNSFRSRIFYPYMKLLKVRRKQPAFHPNAFFEILELDSKVFCIKRYCSKQIVFSITNFSNEDVTAILRGNVPTFMLDLMTGDQVVTNSVKLKPYNYVWFCDVVF